MNKYIKSSENVTELNKEEVVLDLLDYLIGFSDKELTRDIFMTVAIASNVDLNKIQDILNYQFSTESFTQLPDSTRVRYLSDVCAFILMEYMYLSNYPTVPNRDIQYIISRTELKEVAHILTDIHSKEASTISQDTVVGKARQYDIFTVKLMKSTPVEIEKYNASVVVQFLLDTVRGMTSSKHTIEELVSLYNSIMQKEHCVFLSGVQTPVKEIGDVDDLVVSVSDTIRDCLDNNRSYTEGKLLSLTGMLDDLPLPVHEKKFSMLDKSLRDVFFKADMETSDVTAKVAIILLSNILCKTRDYLNIEEIIRL